MGDVNNMMERIKGLDQKMKEGETSIVLLAIAQGRQLVELKRAVPYSWLDKLKEIGIHERVARRFLTIGENWSTDDRTPESDLLAEMPYDLNKLEWLCRLSLEDLKVFTRTCDCRKEARGLLIKRVQRMMGQKTSDAESDAPGLAPLRRESELFVRKMLKASESLGSKDREALVNDVAAKLSELQKALRAAIEPAVAA